jgi:peptide/nickel transport system ATP-binding protein
MIAEKRKALAAPIPVAIPPGASDSAVDVTPPLLAVRDLWVEVASRRGRGAILRGVDLDVRPGELVGVVGETGSGKSTTALAIMRLLPETMRISRGTIDFDGVDLSIMDEGSMQRLRGSRLAMIFQDPRSHLNPVFPIGEQLIDVVRTHHGGRGSEEEAIRLLEQVNLPNPRARLNTYPHQLSGGMAQRVMIAMALAGKPDLLIADEPTSALDVTVQAQILALLRRLATEQGLAVLLISHNVAAVAQVCNRVIVMYAGSVVESARISSLLDDPGHPYTQGLLAAVPKVGARAQDMRGIPGRVPNIFDLPSGCCPFASRCPAVMDHCRTEVPPSFILGPEHSAACFLHE